MRLRARLLLITPLLLFVAVFLACAAHSKLETKRAIPIPKEEIRFDDGDTFSFGGTTIRVLGMDTPEISHPEHGFQEDQPYGRQAAARTEEIVRAAKRISFLPYQNDQYGRLLAHVFVDGDLLAVKLIRDGLAYETVSHYGDNGYPKIGEAILRAAKETPTPSFEPPYLWRQAHRTEPVGTTTE